MDLLQASCQQQAREAISALVSRVPGWAIDTQVDRALEGLRLCYGCCSFPSKLLVKKCDLNRSLILIRTEIVM